MEQKQRIKIFNKQAKQENEINKWLTENPGYKIKLMSDTGGRISLLYERIEEPEQLSAEQVREEQREVDRLSAELLREKP
jgi:hypothetical protein